MGWGQLFGFGIRAAAQPRRKNVRRPGQGRGWDPVVGGDLFAGWLTSRGSADEEVKHRLEEERARARELARSNAWAVGYFRLYAQNVFGDAGIKLIPRVVNKLPDGATSPDKVANQAIADGWKRWGRRGSPTVCGRHSWHSATKLLGNSYRRDGESLVMYHRGGEFGEFGFRIQLFEGDHLPMKLVRDLQSGNTIKFGIERDRFDKPAAYWLSMRHPGETGSLSSSALDTFVRVPASEIAHLYDANRIGQSRGLPSLEAGLAPMNMSQGMEEAELVASRLSASKIGFITDGDGQGYDGGQEAEIRENAIIEPGDPGTIMQLARGAEFKSWDPDHPNTAFGDFLKQQLRKLAAVSGAGYNSLANDLESVNFSSLRAGAITERDFWKLEQGLQIDRIFEPVFTNWLPAALLGGRLGLPADKIDRFMAHRWQGRRWEWVDPKKAAEADTVRLKNRTTTVSRLVEEQGGELRDLFEDVKAEKALEEEFQLEGFLPYDDDSPAAPSFTIEGNE